MRKLVLILLAFIAVITFIKAFDYSGPVDINAVSGIPAGNTESINILETEHQ